MNRLLLKFFNIQRDERGNALIMFAYIFLVIASILIVKPVRNALFLTHAGVEQLPYVFILVACFAVGITYLQAQVATRIRLNRHILFFLSISIGLFFTFWIIFQKGDYSPWAIYLFYIWVALFSVIATSNFWLLANYVFDARQAKRLFGFIGAGAIAGGIFGGYLTNLLANWIGSINMLLFCVLFLGICAIIVVRIWERGARANYSERLVLSKKVSAIERSTNPFQIFFRSRHLAYIAGIIGVGVIVANLVDYQFNAIVSQSILDEDKLTAFFGFWLSNLSILSLAIQIFLTGRITKTFGVIASLIFLPLGIFLGAGCVLVLPALWSAVFIKVTEGSFKQSINRASLELLALPIPSDIKTQSKTVIDVFIDSLATGIGGILLVVVIRFLGFSAQEIGLLIFVLVALWIYFIRLIKPEYVDAFRQAIKKRSVAFEDQTINLDDAAVFESLSAVLLGDNEKQILYVLRFLENSTNPKYVPILKKLLSHTSDEIRLQVLKIIQRFEKDQFLPEVQSLIGDANRDVQVMAIRYIYHATVDGEEQLLSLIQNSDFRVCTAAMLCAAQLNREDSQFRKKIDVQQAFDRFVHSFYENEENPDKRRLMKLNLADIIGIAKDPGLYPFLQDLLKDKALDVVEVAIANAGLTQDPVFIPDLVNHLNTTHVRYYARSALSRYGKNAIEPLRAILTRQDIHPRIRRGILRTLSSIGEQSSVESLFDHLERADFNLRSVIVHSLSKLRSKFPLLRFERKRIENLIDVEVSRYFDNLTVLTVLRTQCPLKIPEPHIHSSEAQYTKVRELLLATLEERLRDSLEMIFDLLGLRYSQRDMSNVLQAIEGPYATQKANALEFLENTMSGRLKDDIMAILDYSMGRETFFFPESMDSGKQLTYVDALRSLLDQDDYWIVGCALHLIAELGRFEPLWMIENLRRHHDDVVRESADYVYARIIEDA